jgi:outer membrane protein assembly factor BamB
LVFIEWHLTRSGQYPQNCSIYPYRKTGYDASHPSQGKQKGIMKTLSFVLISLLTAVALTSCGGGGSSSGGPVTSTLTFPLQSGMKASAAQGYSIDFTVSGTCNGTANLTSSTPIPTTFEGVAAASSLGTVSLSLSNCTPSYFSSSSTDYYDVNYVPLGTITSSGEYGVYTTTPAIPVSVKVGDTGTIGTKIYYTNNTKIFSTGQDVISYVIAPDTANTAIVNIVDKSYDSDGILNVTEQDRYRIKADGSLIPVSADIQFANGDTTHFVLTAIPDTSPPSILSTHPTSYSINVPTTTVITATFNEAVDPATVTAAKFTLKDGTTSISGTVTYSGRTATFTPAAFLTPSTVYTAKITTDVKDLAGNAMSSNYSWQFQTSAPDLTPPTVISTSPVNSATAVAVNSAITATFSEPVDPATITTTEFTLMNGTTPVSGTVTYSGTTATFTLATPLAYGTLYTASISNGVKDLLGNAMAATYTWTFTTGAAPDITPPTVSSVSPADTSTGAGLNQAVTATFSETLTASTVNSATFTLKNGTISISGAVIYSATTATFTPSVPLTLNTVYTATITTGVKDLSGNPMSTNYTWTFTTFALDPSLLPPLSQSVAYQNDYAHSGLVTFGTPITFPASPSWSVTLNGAVSYPLIAGGRVFVTTAGIGTGNGTQLYALDKQSGSILWGPVAIVGNSLWSGLAYDHGKVFVINFEGLLKSFDAATGQAGWSMNLPYVYWADSAPTAVNGIVYVGAASTGTVYAVSESSGNLLWQAAVNGGGQSSPAVSSDGVFVTYPCQAYKFDPLTGATLWHYSGGCSGGGGRTAAYANGLLYMRDWSTTLGLIFNAATGAQTGNFSTNISTPIPAFTTQTGFFQIAGTLQGIDLSTHNVLWSFAGDGHLVSAPIVIDQVVIVGSSSGTVYALDAATGSQIWSGSAGAAITGPDEQNVSQPLTGFGAGEGYLVVPAGKVLSAWHISGP